MNLKLCASTKLYNTGLIWNSFGSMYVVQAVFGALHLMTLIFTVHLKVWPLGKKTSRKCHLSDAIDGKSSIFVTLTPTGYPI